MCRTRSGHSAAMQCVERAVVTACWPCAIAWRKATCDKAGTAAQASSNQPEQVGTPQTAGQQLHGSPPPPVPHCPSSCRLAAGAIVPAPPGHSRAATDAAEVPPLLRMCADRLCRRQRLYVNWLAQQRRNTGRQCHHCC